MATRTAFSKRKGSFAQSALDVAGFGKGADDSATATDPSQIGPESRGDGYIIDNKVGGVVANESEELPAGVGAELEESTYEQDASISGFQTNASGNDAFAADDPDNMDQDGGGHEPDLDIVE